MIINLPNNYNLGAAEKLCLHFGYTLIHQRMSLNAFFVRKDLLPRVEPVVRYAESHKHHPDLENRPWHVVTDEDLVR